jgi:hypothetical protein
MHIDRDASEQDLVIRIWFGCLLEWQCQENKLKNWEKTNCLLHKALTHRFLFLLFGKKKNKNITTTTTSGRVITKFLLAMYYYSSLTRAFVSTPKSYVHPSYVLLFSHSSFLSAHPSSTLLPGHGCAFPCCIFTTTLLLLWPYSLLKELPSRDRKHYTKFPNVLSLEGASFKRPKALHEIS